VQERHFLATCEHPLALLYACTTVIRMRLVFIDDSEQRQPSRKGLGHLRALGAVIFPEAEIAGFAEDLNKIRSELGIPVGEEIKWNPKKGTYLSAAGGDVVSALRRRMLGTAIARDVRSIVVIIDHGKSYRNRSAAEVGREMLKWLFERISMHLAGENDPGVVVADKPGGGAREEKQWLAATLRLTTTARNMCGRGESCCRS
jgi:hypothetical protein